jgi:hypothetical protein
MHAAKLSSPRLKRFLNLLSNGGSYTTRDIIYQAHVCAVNSVAAELRQHGIGINCERKGGRFYYSLGKYTGNK